MTPVDQLVDGSVTCNGCGAAPHVDCGCWSSVHADQPIATHSGDFHIGGGAIRCHVLSNGVRIIDAESIAAFLWCPVEELSTLFGMVVE